MRSVIISIGWVCVLANVSHAATARLDSWSDNDSTFYEYFSDGFFRMDLFSPSFPQNQSFHAISDPSIIYNQSYDGFPNDRFMRFGTVEYDESLLVGGNGTVPITGVTLGIGTDPFDSTFLNFRRFTTGTLVDSFTGTIDVVDGKAIAMDFDADITLVMTNVLGAPETGYYDGTFSVTGTEFEVTARDTEHFTTAFGEADVEFEWDFQGQTLLSADFDGDLNVDGRDFLTWQRGFGVPCADLADGDANLDGEVDGNDLLFWQTQYGFNFLAPLIAEVASIPEPSGLVLSLIFCFANQFRAGRSRLRAGFSPSRE
jgi:hypothetical protein